MFRRAAAGVAIFMGCLLLSGPHVAGQEPVAPSYRIKPSEVVVPPDAKLGGYQRLIRPFENWTLICDENLAQRQRVCNVTQVIEDAAGRLVFSWSLAATKDGKPYMILRTAPAAKSDGLVSLKFDSRKQPVEVQLDGCNEAVCVGMLPVGPIMREQISRNATPMITYPTTDGKLINVNATLRGLSTAVEAIN
ncbi:invasion associated locus B family protein [Sinorhizobium meliloti]|jgi:invasion protein IalB|uniref:invasion associated locus B family protein n=1 Tax=Rhizobium meliloti TaxID=382 RepID=UPI0020C0AFF7|nr:invasion associated locus B family protein [Sinorhizobium meliloti]